MNFSFLSRFTGLCLGLCLAAGIGAYEHTLQVGGYPFPPYVEAHGQTGFEGATLDVLALLNQHQTQVEFVFIPVAAFSRVQSFRQQRFDAIFFESSHWGWQQEDIVFSKTLAIDRDVYVALAKEDRDQRYFDSLESRHLIITRGYHYGFADYQTDESWLKSHFVVDFSPNLDASLEMVSRGRGDVAVLNESYLRSRDLEPAQSSFLVSERSDHEYELGIVLRQSASVDLDWLVAQLRALKEAGKLAPIEERWGIRFTDF